jgi:hypothetical protein
MRKMAAALNFTQPLPEASCDDGNPASDADDGGHRPELGGKPASCRRWYESGS